MARDILVSKASSFAKPDNQKRAFGRVIGSNLFTSDGDAWAKRRRMLAALFTSASVDDYRDVIAQEATSELVALSPGDHDVSNTFSRIALMAVARALFGADASTCRDEFVSLAAELQGSVTRQIQSPMLLPLWIPTQDHRTMKRALRYFHGFVGDLVNARRRSPGNRADLLSKLIGAADEHETLTDREIIDEALTFLLAGSDTTAAAMTWTAYLLAKNPQTQQKLRAAISPRQVPGEQESAIDVGHVFQEAMRLFPPGVAIARQAAEPVEIGGFRLPTGSLAFVSVYTIHRDPRWFSDPEAFRPERFAVANAPQADFTFLPFGAGPRACIGRRLAILEGSLVITDFVRRFELHIPSGYSEPVLETQLSLHPKGGMVLCLVRPERSPT
jgi:cytochrome P450